MSGSGKRQNYATVATVERVGFEESAVVIGCCGGGSVETRN